MGKTHFLYGRNVLKEALALDIPVQDIFCANDSARGFVNQLLEFAKVKVTPRVKQGTPPVGENAQTQGVVFSTDHSFYVPRWDVDAEQFPFILLSNHLEDVQNMGALTRAAAAFGVQLIVHEERRSVRMNAAAVKISAGQAFRMKFLEVANLAPFSKMLADKGYSVVGLEASPNAFDLYEWEPRFPLALVIGSESSGIAKPVANQLELSVQIQMNAEVESLNVQSASSVAMSWVYRKLAKNSETFRPARFVNSKK